MDNANTNTEKISDNKNENIKTIEKPPKIKISDLYAILHLHHCSEVIIRQYPNVKSYKSISVPRIFRFFCEYSLFNNSSTLREKCRYSELFWSIFSPHTEKYGPE